MIDINLLAWCPQRVSRTLLIGIGSGCVLTILLVVGGCWFYYDRMQQYLSVERNQKAQLQSEITALRAQKTLAPAPPKRLIEQTHTISVKPKRELLQRKTVLIHYAKAAELVSLIKDKTNALLSKHGRVMADIRTNIVWLEDTGARIKTIVSMIKQLDVPAQQIVIEARLVNMNQESARDLGIRLGLIAPNQTGSNTES